MAEEHTTTSGKKEEGASLHFIEQIIDAEYRVQQANYPGARHEMPGDQRGGEKPLAEHISIRGHFGTAP